MKTRVFISPGRAVFSVLIFFALILAGCTNRFTTPNTALELGSNLIPKQQGHSTTVFAVDFKRYNTVIIIKRYGVRPINFETVEMTHGFEYELHYEEISSGLMALLNSALKKAGFESIDAFVDQYAAAPPLYTGSRFAAIPPELGQTMYNVALRSDEEINKYRLRYND